MSTFDMSTCVIMIDSCQPDWQMIRSLQLSIGLFILSLLHIFDY